MAAGTGKGSITTVYSHHQNVLKSLEPLGNPIMGVRDNLTEFCTVLGLWAPQEEVPSILMEWTFMRLAKKMVIFQGEESFSP
jgi:hypothetical protein